MKRNLDLWGYRLSSRLITCPSNCAILCSCFRERHLRLHQQGVRHQTSSRPSKAEIPASWRQQRQQMMTVERHHQPFALHQHWMDSQFASTSMHPAWASSTARFEGVNCSFDLTQGDCPRLRSDLWPSWILHLCTCRISLTSLGPSHRCRYWTFRLKFSASFLSSACTQISQISLRLTPSASCSFLHSYPWARFTPEWRIERRD